MNLTNKILILLFCFGLIGAIGIDASASGKVAPKSKTPSLTYLTGAPSTIAKDTAKSCKAESKRLGAKRFAATYSTKHRGTLGKTPSARCNYYNQPRVYKSYLALRAKRACKADWAKDYSKNSLCRSRAELQIAAFSRATYKQKVDVARVNWCQNQALAFASNYDRAYRYLKGDHRLFDGATTAAHKCILNAVAQDKATASTPTTDQLDEGGSNEEEIVEEEGPYDPNEGSPLICTATVKSIGCPA